MINRETTIKAYNEYIESKFSESSEIPTIIVASFPHSDGCTVIFHGNGNEREIFESLAVTLANLSKNDPRVRAVVEIAHQIINDTPESQRKH